MAIDPLKKPNTIATPGAVAAGPAKVTVPLGETAQQFGNTTASGPGSVSMSLDDYSKLPKIQGAAAQAPSSAPASVPAAPAAAPSVTKSGQQIAGNVRAADNVAGVRDYVTSKGYGGAVDWDGENVLVGGQPIKPAFVQNGTAYVDPAALDRLISDYETKNGIAGNKAVADNYMNGYGGRLEELLRPLVDRDDSSLGSFSYDPATDPAFQQYRQNMEEQGQRAFNAVLNKHNASLQTASAAVIAEASAARDVYLRQADEALGEYRDRALGEFESETTRRRNILSDAYNLFNDFYNKSYTANRDQIGDTLTANQLANEERKFDWEKDVRERQLFYELAGSALSNEQAAEGLRSSTMQNRMNEAYSRGYFTPEDARLWGLDGYLHADEFGRMVKADGSILRPWDPEILYALANNYTTSYAQTAAANQANREFGQLQTPTQNPLSPQYTPAASDSLYSALAALAGASPDAVTKATMPADPKQALLARFASNPSIAANLQTLQVDPGTVTTLPSAQPVSGALATLPNLAGSGALPRVPTMQPDPGALALLSQIAAASSLAAAQ